MRLKTKFHFANCSSLCYPFLLWQEDTFCCAWHFLLSSTFMWIGGLELCFSSLLIKPCGLPMSKCVHMIQFHFLQGSVHFPSWPSAKTQWWQPTLVWEPLIESSSLQPFSLHNPSKLWDWIPTIYSTLFLWPPLPILLPPSPMPLNPTAYPTHHDWDAGACVPGEESLVRMPWKC